MAGFGEIFGMGGVDDGIPDYLKSTGGGDSPGGIMSFGMGGDEPIYTQGDVAPSDGGMSNQTMGAIMGATQAVAGVFGGLPNTSFSQNVGIVSMTGVMSRHVVTIAGVIMLLCGLLPKVGATIASMPFPVLGGGVIVMFGMVAAAGMNVLSEVSMNRRNMIIIAISLTVGLGLNLVPGAVQHLPGIWKTLATSAVAPTAFLAIVLNKVLPDEA